MRQYTIGNSSRDPYDDEEQSLDILKRFRFNCKYFRLPETVIGKLDAIADEYARMGCFSHFSWQEFIDIFQTVMDGQSKSNFKSIGKNRELESLLSIKKSLFQFGVHIVKGYLRYLESELKKLNARAMGVTTSLEIATIEEEIIVLQEILAETDAKTDWHGFRSYLDRIRDRISKTKDRVDAFSLGIRPEYVSGIQYSPDSSQSPDPFPPSAESIEAQVRERAWGALLKTDDIRNRRHISKQELERIKANISPYFSYDSITNTIVRNIKNSRPATADIDAVDLEDLEYRKALAKIMADQWNLASPLSIELISDLRKKYGRTAANDEQSYRTLAEIMTGNGRRNPIRVSTIEFDKFEIITYEKNESDPSLYTMTAGVRKHGSNVIEIVKFEANPSEMREWCGIRIRLRQLGSNFRTIDVNILDFNPSRKKDVPPEKNTPEPPKNFWGTAKSAISHAWNSWFPKKAA